MLTCDRKGRGPSYLRGTLDSLDAQGADDIDKVPRKIIVSDGPFEEGADVKMVSSSVAGARPWEVIIKPDGPSGPVAAVFWLFRYALESGASRLIMCEDDIVVCRNGMRRILHTHVPNDVAFVSFFDMQDFPMSETGILPGIHRVGNNGRRRRGFFGHQTVSIPQRTLAHYCNLDLNAVLAKMPPVNRFSHSDILMGQLLTDSLWPCYGNHIPCLVEHVGDVSRLDDRAPRRATRFPGVDFDASKLPVFQ